LLLGKDMDTDKIKLIALSDSLALESRNILVGFISHILSREVKSLKVMEQVRKLCS
jgi:DNA repair protein RecO (recombination protein O)